MDYTKKIIHILHKNRGLDFSGYRNSLLNRRIQKRVIATNSADVKEYLEYLELNDIEVDKLIDLFTINVSRFFRDTLDFEYLSDYSLPTLFTDKIKAGDNSLRVWSAGCSTGEEPYSIAILIKEIIEKENLDFKTTIFATDIDKNALGSAKQAFYSFDSIKNVKYRLLKKYFLSQGSGYKLKSELAEMVTFSEYDILDKKSFVPPVSVYGSFDLVLCRNLLIYFNYEYQARIFDKLYRSLNKNGYLFLGEAEIPIEKFKNRLTRETNFCKIYRKS